MKLALVAAATCAALLGGCGGSGAETPARPASSSPTAAAAAPHIIAANKTCMAAAKLFTQLRDLHEAGADKRYDTFLAAWGKTLATVEDVAENTGGDQQELETAFGALTVYADELAAAMVDANVAFCDPFKS